jgi:uncharacterized repeat protein (TIGR03803 family)
MPALAGEKILHNFNNNGKDGYDPIGGLVFDGAGNLYGTTAHGGARGGGIAFELKPVTGGWTERVLFTFAATKWGIQPEDSLIFDAAGNLYGTTYLSGGDGTAFELQRQADGSFKELILCRLGEQESATLPVGSLAFDASGNLFGTAHSGGPHGEGAVFELTSATGGTWTVSVPRYFSGPPDGHGPRSNVIFDSAGNLFSTTYAGGAHSAGTVFELSPNGDNTWTETILHDFQKDVGDGYSPWASLIFDSFGNLYGTTENGGAQEGTVFELSPNGDSTWSEKILHKFGNGSDGRYPMANLVADAAGNLYGTTLEGGAYGFGTVFKLTPAAGGTWAETVLHNFGNGTDGKYPGYGALIFDSAGNLYGTTSGGGKYGGGMIFEITP